MKRAILIIVVSVVAGVAAFAWLPLDGWDVMRRELLIASGILTAVLLQLMVLTINFLRVDDLTLDEVDTLTAALRRQLHLWTGLFAVVVFAVVLLILGKALSSQLVLTLPFTIQTASHYIVSIPHNIDLRASLSGFTAAVMVFVILRAFDTLAGLLDLHETRATLVRQAVIRRNSAQAEEELSSPPPRPHQPREGRGRMVPFPSKKEGAI